MRFVNNFFKLSNKFEPGEVCDFNPGHRNLDRDFINNFDW